MSIGDSEPRTNTRPVIIGITGNIASGKSAFCNRLQELGHQVHRADIIARIVLESGEVVSALTARWGEQILNNGLPNPTEIAKIVFDNPDELMYLNSVVHPGTLAIMQEIVHNSDDFSVVFEVPLLFEAGIQDRFDYIVLIASPIELRLERIQKRNGLTKDSANRRICSQIPEEEKIPRCDLVIRNTGDIQELIDAADHFSNALSSIKQRETKPFV